MDDELRADEALLRAAFDCTGDAILLLDAQHRVRQINRAAELLTGWTAGLASGRAWSEVLDFGPGTAHAPTALGGPPQAGAYHIGLTRRGGGQRTVLARFEKIAVAHPATPLGTLITLRPHDVVADLRSVLERSEERLHVAFDCGQIGLWEWSADSDTLHEFGAWVGRTLHTVDGDAVSGRVLMQHTHPDDVPQVVDALKRHLRGDSARYEVEQRVKLREGGYVRFLVRGQVVERDADGQAQRIVGTYTDITALRDKEQLLEFALDSGRQGIWAWDAASDTINGHGDARTWLDDYDLPVPLPGATLLTYVHADDLPRIRSELLAHLRGSSKVVEIEVRLRRRDDAYGYFLIRGAARERDEFGRVARMVGTYTEISALRAQERRLQIALENGRQGLWEWEPDSERIHFSREWYAMLGYPEGSITDALADLASIVHPHDAAAGVQAVVPLLKGQCDDFQIEQRFRHHDGHYLHLLSRGRVFERAPDGRTLRVIGTHVDISALKATAAELLTSRRLLEAVLDAFPQRVFWKDTENRYLGCNRRFAADAGVRRPEDLIGRHLRELPWPDIQPFLDDDSLILSGRENLVVSERRFRPVAGAEFWVETQKVPLRGADGEISGILGMYDDVSERRARQHQLEVVANAVTSGKQDRLLNALTRAAAELADADHAFVARLNGDGTATVTACHPAREPLRGGTYPLAGTPCHLSIEHARCFIAADVQAQFPHDALLTGLGIAAYAGQHLATAEGEVIGVFALLFAAARPDEARVRAVIEIFSARATAELDRERTHGVLAASERRLNAAIESGNQGVWEWDLVSDRLITLGAHFRALGFADGINQGTGSLLATYVHPDDGPGMRASLHEYFRGSQPAYQREVRLRAIDGSYHWTLIRGEASDRDASGRVTRMTGTHTDIDALKLVQAALERSQDFLGLVIDTVPQAIFWQDLECRYLGCNQRFAELAALDGPAAIVGKSDAELWWAADSARFHAEDRRLLAGAVSHLAVESKLGDAHGGRRWIELVKVPMRDGAGRIIGLLGAIHDISVRKEAEERAQRLALYDPLTSLPNRRYFSERLEASLAAAVRHGSTGALLFIDMDQFKRINDTLGHSVGDGLLQGVAARLQNVTRQEDMVARLGGDEFVILLPDLAPDFAHCARLAQAVADKIHESLGQPFQFEHHQFHITPTIGISLFPEPGKGVDEVLKEADTAMYSGKADGRNVTRFFRREMEESARERLRLESDLRQALRHDQFELYFQPQLDRAGAVTGAEALLRWHHPERGLIAPGLFIPVAEERGLIVELGRWVLEAAFATFRGWLDDERIDVGELAVNVSTRQFRAAGFVEDVEHLLARYRIPAHRIVLELTEGTIIEDVAATIGIMERLRRLGVLFALDDFGVGYSSLSYLKRLPIDQLKIDRSFIADIGHDQNDEVICQTIIAMGQHLGLQTVAEGVETPEQLEFLRRLRCNRYQGYHFLAPSPPATFLRYCARLDDG